MNTEHEILTVAEAADYLRVNPRTVLTLISTGKIPALKVGRQYRIRLSDLQAALS
ncbi:helix-turn-helix domain-containing protein [Nocardioides sp. WS12]|uniref:helix-turn-helix domain-containing protein n=1 Tax=Nocardioides sp. WS12 TaxID=2486272 RepID=UPI0015FC909A|nr:helix-turn-helix domain-containing protein [Nocardioides sp. WS12]